MKTQSTISSIKIQSSLRGKINPIRNLTPQTLTRILDSFHHGYLSAASQAWEAIERRDDVLQGVASKRKKAISRLPWEIHTIDNSPEAMRHKEALTYFYNNLTASHASDHNIKGGFSLLVKQMLDAVGKKYAVHEIVYNTDKINSHQLTAEFKFVPLWFFENTSGSLRFMKSESIEESTSLEEGAWLKTSGDGLMESCSIAYLFKHLPLKDWLIYCERNGMPGVKGTTDARPGSDEWESALEAVQDFGAEFHALMSSGTDIQPIDLASRGELPYQALVERMDRAMIALWRGSDLTTLSKNSGTGASVQSSESNIIEQDDAAHISETLNSQIDRFVLKQLFGVERGKAYIRILPTNTQDRMQDLQFYKQLWEMGTPIPLHHIQERFGIPQPKSNEPTLTFNTRSKNA